MPKHIAHHAGIFKRTFSDSKNGGCSISTLPSNSIAPRTGSLKTILSTTASAIPVRPRKIKIRLQLTSSAEVPISAAVAKYAAKRKALKEAGDYDALQKLPRNASPVRMHNRCKLTGRPKGYIRQFGISRVTFREMANKGLIPGVTKASW